MEVINKYSQNDFFVKTSHHFIRKHIVECLDSLKEDKYIIIFNIKF